MTEQPELIKAPVTEVDKYEFDPIKGYPMLYWKGKRPFTSTQYYPAQLKETYGTDVNGWRNRIYWGDNLQVMSHLLKEFRGKINLIYIDPPFDSKADYKKKIQLRGQSITNDQNAFEEKQYTDIWTNDEYLQFMYERLVLMRELLADNGSIYVHCDYHKSHYLRCILDEIFGQEKFRNELVWQRTRVSKSQSGSFGMVHDTIFIYVKSDQSNFNAQYRDYPESYIKSHYNLIEEVTNRKYGLWDFTQAGQGVARRFGDKILEPPSGKHWIWSQERIDEGLSTNRIVFTSSGMPRLKRYFDEAKGNAIEDIWTDIFDVNAVAKERENYPTQKPEALLERIIKASSNQNDIVFDCFMGSGTTQAVAMKLGRRFIGADINLGAIQITTKRLISVAEDLLPKKERKLAGMETEEETTKYTSFEVYNVNHYDVFRNPVQAKELLIEALEIQPLPSSMVWDGEKDGRLVKIMPVNRLATRADLNELIANFDYKSFQGKFNESPHKAVEKILLVCMGHEPDLAAHLQKEAAPYKLDIEVVDILRDRSKLEFKRESQAKVLTTETELIIEKFYPMNLLQKLSLFQENVEDWRELVESVMIDFNYDGVIFQPALLDIPDKTELVKGIYEIPSDAGNIRVKITDLLSESLEVDC
jgi:adenine-specific DNA-methyltransferase